MVRGGLSWFSLGIIVIPLKESNYFMLGKSCLTIKSGSKDSHCIWPNFTIALNIEAV